MECQVTDLGQNKKKFLIELSEGDFSSELEAVLKEMAKVAEFPGFRKGKVPVNHLRAQIGKEKLRADALGQALPKYLQEAIDSKSVDAIAVSDVQVLTGLQEGASVSFEANVEVRPELKLKGYSDIKVTVPPISPTPEEIAEIEANYLKSFGDLKDVSRSAIKGDHLTIDLHSTFNGEDVEGMNVSDYVYEIGFRSVIEEMDKELTGSKVGDILEFNAPHPGEEGNMRVRVFVKKIQENKLPTLDNELVKKISEFETTEEFREDMVTQIKESKRNSIVRVAQDKILEELVKLSTDPIPEALIENEIEQLKAGFPEEHHAELEAQMKEQAVNTAKIDLCIRSIIKQEKLEVEGSEVEEAVKMVQEQIEQMAKDSKDKSTLDLQPNIGIIRNNLIQQKAMEWLIEHSHITDENNLEVDAKDLKPPKIKEEENKND